MSLSFTERAALLLVPKPFQEFLAYVSPSALRVIHKDKVLGLALDIVGRTLSRGDYDRDCAIWKAAVEKANLEVDVVDKIETPLSLAPVTDGKLIGERILEVYFLLIHAEVPLDLDLRPNHFGWNSETKRLLWCPSRLRHRRSAEFHARVVDLYRGFFADDRVAAGRGLELYRWDSAPADGYDERMESLLRIHFGDVRSGPIRFDMKHFKETFHLSFEEAIRSKSRFHPELTFLGTALAGLYVTLGGLDIALDVRSAYEKIVQVRS